MICTESTKRSKQQNCSATKAYVLLQSVEHCHSQVIKTLKCQAGVVTVDLIEGPPDIVFVVEARNRKELASILMNALTSVQNMTEGLELYPTQMQHREKYRRITTSTAEGNV